MQVVFEKQLELIRTLSPKEHRLGNTLTDDLPVDVNTHAGQRRIRECISRLNEELHEFHTAPPHHQCEEFIDGLHFLVDLCIRVGITHDQVRAGRWLSEWGSVPVIYVWHNMMMLQGKLKLKDWRENAPLIGHGDVAELVLKLAESYIALGRYFGWTEDDLIQEYMAKHTVNVQRQQNNY